MHFYKCQGLKSLQAISDRSRLNSAVWVT